MHCEKQRGRVHHEGVLRDEFRGNLRTCLAAENLLAFQIPLPMSGKKRGNRGFDPSDPAAQNRGTERNVPFADHQLVKPLVPREPAGKVRSAGNRGY